MITEERNKFNIIVMCGSSRVIINMVQYGYVWNVWLGDSWGSEGLTQVDAINNFFKRMDDYIECGQ